MRKTETNTDSSVLYKMDITEMLSSREQYNLIDHRELLVLNAILNLGKGN